MYSDKTFPRAALCITNPKRCNLGLNLGHCYGKPATNSLSYGIAKSNTLYTSGFEPVVSVLFPGVYKDILGGKPKHLTRYVELDKKIRDKH
jgi:hypothetical protein